MSVIVVHDEMHFLFLLEEVSDADSCHKLRVQVVFNGLSLTDLYLLTPVHSRSC